MNNLEVIGCIANLRSSYAMQLQKKICDMYPQIIKIEKLWDHIDYQTLIVIGGDGFMLRALHNYLRKENNSQKIQFFGINAGNLGHLLNDNVMIEQIIDIMENADQNTIGFLEIKLKFINGTEKIIHAINEVGIMRDTHMASNISIYINESNKMNKFVGDGLMVATPVGSTAYNISTGGQILPLSSNLLSLTAINAFSPLKWSGALLKNDSIIRFVIHRPHHRKVRVFADNCEFFQVSELEINFKTEEKINLLFTKNHNLEHKILKMQF